MNSLSASQLVEAAGSELAQLQALENRLHDKGYSLNRVSLELYLDIDSNMSMTVQKRLPGGQSGHATRIRITLERTRK